LNFILRCRVKITTSWKEEGILEGEIRGEARGEARGLIKGLDPALRLRFGPAAAPFLERLRTCVDTSRLERIAQEVATAPNIEALARIAFDHEP